MVIHETPKICHSHRSSDAVRRVAWGGRATHDRWSRVVQLGVDAVRSAGVGVHALTSEQKTVTMA